MENIFQEYERSCIAQCAWYVAKISTTSQNDHKKVTTRWAQLCLKVKIWSRSTQLKRGASCCTIDPTLSAELNAQDCVRHNCEAFPEKVSLSVPNTNWLREYNKLIEGLINHFDIGPLLSKATHFLWPKDFGSCWWSWGDCWEAAPVLRRQACNVFPSLARLCKGDVQALYVSSARFRAKRFQFYILFCQIVTKLSFWKEHDCLFWTSSLYCVPTFNFGFLELFHGWKRGDLVFLGLTKCSVKPFR